MESLKPNRQHRNLALTTLFVSVVLFSGTNKIVGQNTSHLPPQKAAVVKQLKDELAKRHYLFGCIMNNAGLDNAATSQRQRLVEEALDNLDPILVGKYVVFSKKFLNHIGPNKSITAQQFEIMRDRTDRVYDAYKELTGKAPGAGEKVFINIAPEAYFRNPKGGHYNGHAHANMSCLNELGVANGLKEAALHNSLNSTIMHELAHVFAYATNWEVNPESVVPLLMAYAYETVPEAQIGSTPGNKSRISRFEAALDNFRKNKIVAFALDDADDSGYGAHAFDFYLLGLVDQVGWDTYKKVIRSYADEPHVTHARFPGGQAGKARDLFNRIERVSGKPGVLRTLPDKGELLDKFFTVQVSTAKQTTDTSDTHVVTTTSRGASLPYDSPYEDIFEAAEMGTARDVASFVNKGNDVNAKNEVGFTALHYAAHYNQNIDVLRYLVSAGADINAKTNLGRTPLHQAALSDDADTAVLKYLIAQGADVNAKSNTGQTPLDIANTEAKKTALRAAGGKSGK